MEMTFNKRKWGAVMTVLLLLCVLCRNRADAQCVDPSSSVRFTNTGQSTTGYTTIYVLTNGNDIIQRTVTSPFTAPAPEGNYKVYAINYRTGETDPVITAGIDIHSIGGSCAAISAAPMEFSVCICVSAGSPVSFSINNNNAAGTYQTRYVVAATNGNVLSSSATGVLTAPTGAGEFQVYSINYKTGETDPVLLPGTQINAMGGSCVTKSTAPVRFKVCSSYDYGNLPVDGGTVWPVSYAGVACVLSGNAPAAYNINSNPFFAVYAGTQISIETQSPVSGVDAGNDGVVLPDHVSAAGVAVDYTVTLNANSTGRMVYYRVWFDWNNDGNFANDLDGNSAAATYAGGAIVNGPANVVIPVTPPLAIQGSYKLRLAVSDAPVPDLYRDNSATSVLGIANGEIEDYTGLALNTLPLQLSAFTAVKQNTTALLKWSTASEQNTGRFILERSSNGSGDWQVIATIGAAGTSDDPRFYQFVDGHPFDGTNYYRLRMVDLDGGYEISSIQLVRFDTGIKITMYPNPAKDVVNLVLPVGYEKVTVVVRDLASRQLMKKSLQGGGRQEIEVAGLLPGMYMLEVIKGDDVIWIGKVVKAAKL